MDGFGAGGSRVGKGLWQSEWLGGWQHGGGEGGKACACVSSEMLLRSITTALATSSGWRRALGGYPAPTLGEIWS